jgi:rhodanese-related sulfurtransferase
MTWIAGSLACAWAFAVAAQPPAPPPAATPSTAASAETEAPPHISAPELAARLRKPDDKPVVLDVRTPAEFAAGRVPGARNISHDELPARLGEFAASKDQDVVLYCRSGRRSQIAAQVLREAGYTRLLQLQGDFPGWEASGQPVERAATGKPD